MLKNKFAISFVVALSFATFAVANANAWTGLAAGAGTTWVLDQYSPAVNYFLPSGCLYRTALPFRPSSIAATQHGAWVGSADVGRVALLENGTATVFNVAAGRGETAFVASDGNDGAWVAPRFDSKIWHLDEQGRKTVYQVYSKKTQIVDLAADQNLVAIASDKMIRVLNPQSHSSTDFHFDGQPSSIIAAHSGIWALLRSPDRIVLLKADGGRQTITLPSMSASAGGAMLAPDGDGVLVLRSGLLDRVSSAGEITVLPTVPRQAEWIMAISRGFLAADGIKMMYSVENLTVTPRDLYQVLGSTIVVCHSSVVPSTSP